MPGATPADPEVHAQPLDPNAAGATTPPTTTTPGSTKVDPYPQAPGTIREGMPAKSGAQTTQEEPGGKSTSFTPSTLEESGHAAPAQGGGTTAAAPGTLPAGGDNRVTANTHQNPGGASRPTTVTQDPETPVEPVTSTNRAPYLSASVAQEPYGY